MDQSRWRSSNRPSASVHWHRQRRSVIWMPLLLVVMALSFPSMVFGCSGVAIPADAVVLRGFAPIGRWAGHWGIDIAASEGSAVRSVGGGVVRFQGVVVRNRTVSIDHGGGLVTSYSYLAATHVARGDRIEQGASVGLSGLHDGRGAFHLSLRVGGKYVDPLGLSRCFGDPSRGLYLAVGSTTYAVGRARDSRRHIRPAPQRSHRYGTSRLYAAGTRRRATYAGR
jgi:murein DD-endopeptidase MepM/ murein hydrolase activator NlpD